MRAAVLHAYGEPPVPGERPAPDAGDDRVLVDVTAAPIASLDLICASGTSYLGAPSLPYVPGVQGVGRIGRDEPLGPHEGPVNRQGENRKGYNVVT